MEEESSIITGKSKVKVKIVACTYCRGTGVITTRKFYGHTDGYKPVNKMCGVCEGRRVLEKRTEITYRKV